MQNASSWLVGDPHIKDDFPEESLTWEMVEEASERESDLRRATRATTFVGTSHSQHEIEEEEAYSYESMEEEEYVEEGDDSDDDGLDSDADASNNNDDSYSY
ncbi:hypothetical protein AMTR_s00050p00064630 [Amborella trichopoda]|uniref:Uncharacterized protein n=1 Tax=Amborella trichopoda TaxID=13333 RepID=W1PZ73_AMBTC|nr:hypothetical protein AMTR_s00050p00064630 [Amborella trichopoda]